MYNDYDDGDDQVDPLQLKALLLWRSTKLPLASISCKIGANVEFVKQTVKKYKRLVKKQLRYNTANVNKKRSIISDDNIQEIREFWMWNRNRPMRLTDIRKEDWKVTMTHKRPAILLYQMSWERNSGWAIASSDRGTIKQLPENTLDFTEKE